MIAFIIELAVLITLLIVLACLIIYFRKKIRNFLMEYFNTPSLKQAIENSKIADSENKKSVYSMENIYLDSISKDFPALNINELKSSAEMNIRNILYAIETKNKKNLQNKNDRIYHYVESKIEDLKDNKVRIDNIKFHKTVLNKYEKKNGIVTMYFQTSMEYFYKKNDELGRKIQTRYDTEFIHVIDTSDMSYKIKTFGINCPNCGAPVKDIDNPHCEYCTSGLIIPESGVEAVKHIWFLNNIKEI